MNDRIRFTAAALVVVAACVVVFGQSVGFSFVNWDDDLHVLTNSAVTDPGSVTLKEHLLTPYLGYPVPVTVASYILDYAVAGPDSAWFHVVNLIFHVGTALAVLACVALMGFGPVVSAVCALLFALHPAVGEPVVWVSGRKDLLATFFAMTAVASYLAALKKGGNPVRQIPAVAAAVIAGLSKPSALLLPLLFIVLESRRAAVAGKSRNTLAAAGMWTAVLAFDGFLAWLAFKQESGVGALDGSAGSGVVERVLAGAGWHARILLQPFDLMPKYLDPTAGPATTTLVTGGLFVAAIVGLTVAAFVLSIRRPDSKSAFAAFTGLLVAVLAYAPQSGVVPLSRQYANSYLYFSLAGIALAAASAGPVVTASRRRVRILTAAGCVVVLAGLGLAAAVQARTYRDGVSLWSAVFDVYPDSPQVCRNLGNAYMYGSRNEPESAVRIYRHCIDTMGNRQFFLKNLAVATFKAGRPAESKALFEELVATKGQDPVAGRYLELIRQAGF